MSQRQQAFKSTAGKKLALIDPDVLKRLVTASQLRLADRQQQQQRQQDDEDMSTTPARKRMKTLGRDMERLLGKPGWGENPDTTRARFNMALTDYRRLARQATPQSSVAPMASGCLRGL